MNQNLNFCDRDLKNRCFKGQNLDGANFSYSDIRGCNFSYASLREANFENVKAGQPPQIFLCLIILTLITAIIVFHAVSQMIFGVIERTPESPVWGYGVALSISLGIAGIVCAVMSLVRKSILKRIAIIASGTTSGAILGFFYGGIAGGKNPQVAIASAVIGALIIAFTSFYFKKGFILIILSAAGTVITYGFAFLIGTRAIAFLTTQNLFWGFILNLLSLTYIGLTLISLNYTLKQITTYSVTSFQNSNLTNANFNRAKLGLSNFTNAVGKI